MSQTSRPPAGKSEPPKLDDEELKGLLLGRINSLATKHGDYYLIEGMKESQAFFAILSALVNLERRLTDSEALCQAMDKIVKQKEAALGQSVWIERGWLCEVNECRPDKPERPRMIKFENPMDDERYVRFAELLV